MALSKSILITEPDSVTCANLARSLSAAGYRTIETHTFHEMELLLGENNFDLICCNPMLPDYPPASVAESLSSLPHLYFSNEALFLPEAVFPYPGIDAPWFIQVINSYFETQELKESQNLSQMREEEDLDFTQILQKSLAAPEQIRNPAYEIVSRYIPCREIGGDFLDIVELKDHVYIISADVAGQGLKASFFSYMLKSLIKSVLNWPMPTETLMNYLSAEVKKYLVEDFFITLNLIKIDFRNQQLEYTHAGHPPFLVMNPQKVTLVRPRSSFIFSFSRDHWQTRTLELSPGDSVLVFTDGLFEIFDASNNELGVRFIYDFVSLHNDTPPADLIDEMVSELSSYREGKGFDDDVSLCLFRLVG